MAPCDCPTCDYYEERAAIREYDGGQSKAVAEQEAATETVRQFGREAIEHMQEAGTVAKHEQVGLFG